MCKHCANDWFLSRDRQEKDAQTKGLAQAVINDAQTVDVRNKFVSRYRGPSSPQPPKRYALIRGEGIEHKALRMHNRFIYLSTLNSKERGRGNQPAFKYISIIDDAFISYVSIQRVVYLSYILLVEDSL